jgi:hypothetical protein
MEPEGVVDVLRQLLRVLVPGGAVVDLVAIPPSGTVESRGEVLGQIDEEAFFARALVAVSGLDALVAEGLLAFESEERFPLLVRYPTGQDAVDDVAGRTYGRMPAPLAERVAAIHGPVLIRETSVVRRFTKLAADE